MSTYVYINMYIYVNDLQSLSGEGSGRRVGRGAALAAGRAGLAGGRGEPPHAGVCFLPPRDRLCRIRFPRLSPLRGEREKEREQVSPLSLSHFVAPSFALCLLLHRCLPLSPSPSCSVSVSFFLILSLCLWLRRSLFFLLPRYLSLSFSPSFSPFVSFLPRSLSLCLTPSFCFSVSFSLVPSIYFFLPRSISASLSPPSLTFSFCLVFSFLFLPCSLSMSLSPSFSLSSSFSLVLSLYLFPSHALSLSPLPPSPLQLPTDRPLRLLSCLRELVVTID